MRNLVVTTAAVMAALVLLYGGLNLAERGMNEMMEFDRSYAAFSVRKGESGDITFTFGGKYFTFNLDRLMGRLRPDHQR